MATAEEESVKEEDVNNDKTLSQLFEQAMKLFDEISKTSEATNSLNVQIQIKSAIGLFEDATRLVSTSGMFSTNESVEEVATSNLKYFLLPALLGTLSLKLCVENRMEVVRISEIYFRDFLTRCKNYSITDVEIPESKNEDDDDKVQDTQTCRPMDLMAMARDRNRKIENYRQKKQLESELESLRRLMSSANITDEDTERKYYLTLIESYVRESVDEINSLEMEKPILEHMAKMRQGDTAANKEKKPKRPPKPLQAVIITRDEIQKKVFGAGYPSLPTMTVQEFYDQKIKEGIWTEPGKCLQEMVNDPADESEEIKQEELIERDDPQKLKQAREFDEYKDTHRRGWGNRMNRS